MDKNLLAVEGLGKNQVDDAGEVIQNRIYNVAGLDRGIIFPSATKWLLSASVHSCMEQIHERDDCLCSNIDYIKRMQRALVNVPENTTGTINHRYVIRITGDNDEEKAELDNFIDPKAPYPVIATRHQSWQLLVLAHEHAM